MASEGILSIAKMPVSELRLIKRCAEFLQKTEISRVPSYTRGIYALFKYNSRLNKYDVVYIGMAAGTKTASIRGRLRVHRRRRGKLWSHFSVFEVWDNIREEEVKELEGLFRHIYRKDTKANSLNQQRAFKKLAKVRHDTQKDGWMKESPHERE
jgi:hypothetical protein